MAKRTQQDNTDQQGNQPSFSANITNLDTANRLLGSVARIVRINTARRVSFETKIDQVLWVILDHLGVEQGSIMLLRRKALEIKASSRKKLVGSKQPLHENSVAGWVAINKKPLFIPDITKDHRFPKRSGAYKKNALLSTPVMDGKRLIGVINVSDKEGHTDFFQDDIAFLIDFSSLILSLIIQDSLAEQIKKQRNTLRKRNQELQRQEAMRAELSRMLIHDLKGPLSEVVANLDILSYSASGDAKEFIEAAQTGCDRAVRMAENLATIGRIEDGKLELIRHDITPQMLVNEALSNVKGMASLKNVKLENLLTEDLPALLVDRVLILRVLQNLLMNALNYSTEGNTITIDCRPVAGRRLLCFSVADQGPGIPEKKQATIFEKYVRLQRREEQRIGTGLGLYFCKLAVKIHRGTVGVENRPEGGSRFFFTLPLQDKRPPVSPAIL